MFGVDFAPKKIRNVFELRVYKLGSKQIVWLRYSDNTLTVDHKLQNILMKLELCIRRQFG